MREKFSARTILIPVFAVVGFFLVQLFIAVGYMLILSVFIAITNTDMALNDPDKLTATLEKLFLEHSNVIAAIYSVITATISIIAIKILLHKNPHAIRQEKVSKTFWILAPIVMIACAGAVTLLMSLITFIGQQLQFVKTLMDDYIKLSESFVGNGNIILVILSTCILVPIAEDLVFRGIIQGELRRVMPAWAAIVIQGVIFALVHMNPIQISYVIIPALALGTIYEWSKSIYVPIFLHMIFNFVGAALPLMIGDNEQLGTYYTIALIVLIPAGLISLFFLYQKRVKDIQIVEIASDIA